MQKPNNESKNLRFEVDCDMLDTYHRAYMIILSVISALEVGMLLFGFLNFDLSDGRRIGYLASYFFLLVLSLITLSLLAVNHKKKTLFPLVTKMVTVYSAGIVLWSAAISILDVVAGNTMIVFMTVIMCVAAIMNVPPVFYSVLIGSLATLQLVFALEVKSELVMNLGYLINFPVFVLFAAILCFVKCELTRRNYLYKKRLERLSYFDQLTGVYNRHSLKDYISSISNRSIFYFGIVDVDNFKSVNDTFGHDVGDQCLRQIALLLSASFGDRIYRYGGDEFVIITTMREQDLPKEIDEVNAKLSSLYQEKNIHISAGFYCPVSDSEQYQDYFKKADSALYFAKSNGKSKAIIYHEK